MSRICRTNIFRMRPGIGRFVLSTLVAAVCATTCTTRSHAQASKPDFDAALTRLASQIAAPLAKHHRRPVIVAELRGPEGQPHPAGRLLAEKLSAILQRDYSQLQPISFTPLAEVIERVDPPDDLKAFEATRKWAKNLGAKVVITGSFGRAHEGIGVSLRASEASSGKLYGQANGELPISDEIAAVSPGPIPEFKGSIPKAGFAGVDRKSVV